MDERLEWQIDPASELGRISRQQDFLRRVLQTALDRGITDPSVARSLISSAQDNLVVDQNLTLGRMLEYVSLLASLSPDQVAAFQIETTGAVVGGQTVLLPQIDGENMRAVLALFRGETMFVATDPTLTSTPAAPLTSVESAPGRAPDPAAVVPEENPMGIVPPREIRC